MYGGWSEGLVWWGDEVVFGGCSYSALVDLKGCWLSSTCRLVPELLSDSQSVLRVMNPRVRKGVANETFFELSCVGSGSG